MSARTITLSSEIADQLEALAEQQGQSIDDLLGTILNERPTPPNNNWAKALVKDMAEADIDWIDDPLASTNSKSNFSDAKYQEWLTL